MNCKVRFVHKISQDSRDVRDIALPENAFANIKTLGAALRKCGVLLKGERISDFWCKTDGTWVAFPVKSVWHAFVFSKA